MENLQEALKSTNVQSIVGNPVPATAPVKKAVAKKVKSVKKLTQKEVDYLEMITSMKTDFKILRVKDWGKLTDAAIEVLHSQSVATLDNDLKSFGIVAGDMSTTSKISTLKALRLMQSKNTPGARKRAAGESRQALREFLGKVESVLTDSQWGNLFTEDCFGKEGASLVGKNVVIVDDQWELRLDVKAINVIERKRVGDAVKLAKAEFKASQE